MTLPELRKPPLADPQDYSHVAVLIPCYNEVLTVGKVVGEFARALPGASVFVFDNNSTDGTAAAATGAGAVVVHEKRQGKGNVIASMLESVEAEWYILVDGDDTYDANAAPSLLAPLLSGKADMTVAQRLAEYGTQSFRPLHLTGNRLIVWLVNRMFNARLTDIMSGYRAFSHDVALSLPVVASGFDVETEMTLQLLHRRFVIREVPVPYRARPEGSASKLRTFPDGFRVLAKIFGVLKAYRPMTFFGFIALTFFVIGAVTGYFPIVEYVRFRFVYSVPKAILAASCMIMAAVSLSIGVLLHTLNFHLLESTAILTRQVGRGRRFRVGAGGADAPPRQPVSPGGS